MESDDLKTWQAAKIHTRLSPTLGYLSRLRARMDKQGFPLDDRLYRAVSDAYNALHALCVETHYLSCKNGVGRLPRK